MEWFWQIIERLQNSVLVSALQSFQPVDWICLFAILWGLAQGSRKGFSEMFGKLTGLFFVSMLTLQFYKPAAKFLTSNLPGMPLKVASVFSFVLLTIFLGLSISWCINVTGKVLKVEARGLLQTLGGMVLGGARMILLMSYLVQFLLFLPIDSLQKTFKPGKTYAGYKVARLLPALHGLVMSPFSKSGKKTPVVSYKTGG